MIIPTKCLHNRGLTVEENIVSPFKISHRSGRTKFVDAFTTRTWMTRDIEENDEKENSESI